MSIAVRMVASVIPISLCAVIPSAWIVYGVVMVKMIVVIIPMKKAVIQSPVALPAVMMSSNVAAVIAYPNPSSVMTPTIAVMALMKLVAVSFNTSSFRYPPPSFSLTLFHVYFSGP